MLPEDVLAAHGVVPEAVIADPSVVVTQPLIQVLAHEGLMLLRRMRLPRMCIGAALPAVLARRDLRRAPAFPVERGLGDRLAVTLAGLAGRV
jgi:phytoene synthase